MKNLIYIFFVNMILLFIVLSACGGDLTQHFLPRSVCMLQNEKLISIYGISNAVTFLSYIGIAFILIYFFYIKMGSEIIPIKSVLFMFAAFIFLCGITHLVSVINLWVTYYWIDAYINMLTAFVSMIVFIILWKYRHEYISFKELKVAQEVNRVLRDQLQAALLELQKLKKV